MIVAHAAAGEHAVTMIIAAGLFAAYWLLWMRASTPNLTPVACAGAATLAVTVISLPTVENLASATFTAHMIQHLVLWVVIPPLVLAAHPVATARRAGLRIGSQRTRCMIIGHARLQIVGAWVVVIVTMYATHLTSFYDTAIRIQVLHEVEHAAYLASSVWFWASVLGGRRSLAPWRVALALGVITPMVLLGMILTTVDEPIYTTYLEQLGPVGAAADLRNGGSIMWLGSMAGLIPLLVLTTWRWAVAEHRAQLLIEGSERSASIPDATGSLDVALGGIHSVRTRISGVGRREQLDQRCRSGAGRTGRQRGRTGSDAHGSRWR